MLDTCCLVFFWEVLDHETRILHRRAGIKSIFENTQKLEKYPMMPTSCTRPGTLVKFGIFMILMMTPRCTRLGRCQRGISTSALLVPEHLDRFLFVDIAIFKIMKNIIFNININIIIIIIEPARYVQQQTQSVEARMGET